MELDQISDEDLAAELARRRKAARASGNELYERITQGRTGHTKDDETEPAKKLTGAELYERFNGTTTNKFNN